MGKRSVWSRATRAIGRAFGVRSNPYDAANTADRGRRGQQTRNLGPNAVGAMSAVKLRAFARDMARNDAHCARAVGVIAGNVVGTGITPRVVVEDPVPSELRGINPDLLQRLRERQFNEGLRAKLREQGEEVPEGMTPIDHLYSIWSERGADIEGVHTLEALQGLAARAWVESGESFVVRRWDSTAAGVPMRVEVLEADMLDETKNVALTDAQGKPSGRIIQGVEFDKRGRRVAYHFRTEHPGESFVGAATWSTVRIDAKDVIHLFLPLRPKQVRGLSFLAPILSMKSDLATFERYELARKQTEAAVAAFVIPADGIETDEDEGLVPAAIDDDGNRVEDLQSRTILRLRNGKDVKFNQVVISANYDTYKRANLQSTAVGMMMSYEWLSGDLSQANYSSLRAGLVEFWRYVDELQWNHFVPKVCVRIWAWFIEAAYLSGAIDSPFITAEWATPKRASVDPARELLADILAVRAGFEPWEAKVQERGWHPRRLLADIAAMQKKLEADDIILDIDPSHTDFRGAMRNDRRGGGAGGSPPPSDDSDVTKEAS